MANPYTVGRITQLTQPRGDDGLAAAVNRVAAAMERHAELVAIERRISKGKRGRPKAIPAELLDALPPRRGRPPKA